MSHLLLKKKKKRTFLYLSKINATEYSNLHNPNRFHPPTRVNDSKRLHALVNPKLIKGDVSAGVRV